MEEHKNFNPYNIVNIKTKAQINSAMDKFETARKGFEFEQEHFTIKEAFFYQKQLLLNDLVTCKKKFEHLIEEEKNFLNSQPTKSTNYELVTGPTFSNTKTSRKITVGNTVNINLVDALSFSSGDYKSAQLKLKKDENATNFFFKLGNTVSDIKIKELKSYKSAKTYNYRKGNIDRKSYYSTNQSQFLLDNSYSYTYTKQYYSTEYSLLKHRGSAIVFSTATLSEKLKLSFGIGGPFIYMTPFQISTWVYFGITRFFNLGCTLQANNTTLLSFEYNTVDITYSGIRSQRSLNSISAQVSKVSSNDISKNSINVNESNSVSSSSQATVITVGNNGEKTMIGSNTAYKDTPRYKMVYSKKDAKKVIRNLASVLILALFGLVALFVTLLIRSGFNKKDDKKLVTESNTGVIKNDLFIEVNKVDTKLENGEIIIEVTGKTVCDLMVHIEITYTDVSTIVHEEASIKASDSGIYTVKFALIAVSVSGGELFATVRRDGLIARETMDISL